MLVLMAGTFQREAVCKVTFGEASRAVQSMPEWKLFSSRQGGFSVLMPGSPKEETELKDFPVVGKGETHLFILAHESGVYIASYLEIPGLARQDQSFCDSFGKGFLKTIGEATAKGAGGKVVSETDILFGRAPGKEILMQTSGGVATARAYFIRRHGYELIAAPAAGADAGNVKKFLDSFKTAAQ
jgi:hypothetical protein